MYPSEDFYNSNEEPKNKYFNKVIIFYPLLLSFALAIGVYLGILVNPAPVSNTEKETISKINSLLNLIEDKYVDSINRDELTEQSLRAIISRLDPHSSYMTAEDFKRSEEELSGNFGGVGIQFLIVNDTLCVTHVIEYSPSEDAGVIPFDRIIRVDSISMAGRKITNNDVFKHLRGEIGTRVKIKILRNRTDTLNMELKRDAIPVSSVDASFMLDEYTGYIKLTQFGATTYEDFIAAVNKLNNRGMKQLIFDLRDNGGGYLDAAIKLSDEFLDKGKLIVYTEGKASPKETYKATSKGRLHQTKLAILINHNSASASEIVAGAVQDNDRGIILGRRSFGKGLVQQQFKPFADESAIRLTVARYYTPTGRCIQKPYGNGIDYDNEQLDRYNRNEFFVPDSSIFVDSLKYTTPKGKIVYGGGGIMPDIFIPLDTTYRTSFFSHLQYLEDRPISAFIYLYLEKYHHQLKSAYKSATAFNQNFEINNTMYNSFFEYLKNINIRYSDSQKKQSETIIKRYLKAEIARFLWNNDGYYRVLTTTDADVQKALYELNNH
jgi:carboxyl-terminal processing protease